MNHFSDLMTTLTVLTTIAYILNIIKLYDLSITEERRKYLNKKLCIYWILTAIFGFTAFFYKG